MTRARRTAASLALVTALVIVAGSRPQCDGREIDTLCASFSVSVLPGECTEITDPCGNGWQGLFSLMMVDTIDGVWLEVERRTTGNTVRVCADAQVGVVVDWPMRLIFSNDAGVVNGVDALISTVPELGAAPAVTPPNPVGLDTFVVEANASGGVPPYDYEWQPATSIVGSNRDASITAVADGPEVYTVRVTDETGTYRIVEYTVPIIPLVTVTCHPDTISVGGHAYLSASVHGALVYSEDRFWTPGKWLDSTVFPQINCWAKETTTYTYHVYSARHRLHGWGSVTVHVRPAAGDVTLR